MLLVLAAALLTQVPPAEVEAAPPLEAAPPQAVEAPPPVRADPGWARQGGVLGLALAAVPLGLAVGATVALWTNNPTAQDVLMVSSGLSAPLLGLLPTFGSRSAVMSDELTRKPRIFRIVGWVLTIYGAISTVGSVVIGKLWGLIAQGITLPFSTGVVGQVFGTVGTLINGLICTAGVVVLSIASLMAANRAAPPSDTAGVAVMPTVTLVPLPGGAFAGMAGLAGRF